MGTYRMYTDADGKARWEAADLASTPKWTEGLDCTQIRFGLRQPGVLQAWHPAPQRQFVIILSGQLEIGFEDGSKMVFGPGDAPPGRRHHRRGPHHDRARHRAVRHSTIGLKTRVEALASAIFALTARPLAERYGHRQARGLAVACGAGRTPRWTRRLTAGDWHG